MRPFIHANPDACTGCGICQLVCSLAKEGVMNPKKARIKIVRKGVYIYAHACHRCEDPPCVKACPKNALTMGEDGIVRLDRNKCIKCGVCAKACPYGVIVLHPETKYPLICDLCDRDMPCVKACPREALEFSTATYEL